MSDGAAFGSPVGLLWTFWSGDVSPSLPVLPDLSIVRANLEGVRNGFGLDEDDVANLVAAGHVPYIARLGSSPVAYGWSASRQTFFGEPPITFTVPYANRYLRDFVTLPASRGLGVYPRMLQKIVEVEKDDAKRFWIVHEYANRASARGIRKAGFDRVAEVYRLPDRSLGLVGSGERGAAGARLLGLPLLAS